MNSPLVSETFLRELCATYSKNEAQIAQALEEYQQMMVPLAMMRTAVEVTEPSNPDFILFVNGLLAYLKRNNQILKSLSPLAKQATLVLREHEE